MTNQKNKRINYSSNSPWEPIRGYSRAVRVGDHLFISGTTAVAPGGTVIAPNEAYEQTKYVLTLVKKILSTAGFSLEDVVRTRMFVTNMAKWDEYARAHREVFEMVRPASSIVQVTKLVDPRLVLEMEVEALRGATEVSSISLGDISQ
jgi:enamine deaminase RidA (YjgF/YER057c/UK114 family)